MSAPLIGELPGLPEFEVTDFKQNEYDKGFYVRRKIRPSVCPACDVVLAQAAASIPFIVLDNEYKVSDAIIRKAFTWLVSGLPQPSQMEIPSVLGIDEICLDYLHSREALHDYDTSFENFLRALKKDF